MEDIVRIVAYITVYILFGASVNAIPFIVVLHRYFVKKTELVKLQCEQTRLEIDTLNQSNKPIPVPLKPREPGWHPPTFALLHSAENQQSTG